MKFLPALRGYAVAGAMVGLALAFGFLLGPDIQVQVAPLLFIAAGVLAAWFAGLGPGLAAVALSAVLVLYIWVEPRYSFVISLGQIPWFLIFILTGLAAMGLSLHRRRFEAEMADREADLELRVAERTTQLHASEERWRRLFETSSVGIAVTEPGGRFLQANRALQLMLGYSEAALRQMRLADLVLGVDAGDSRTEMPLRRANGDTVWVNLSLSVIPVGDGMPLTSAVIVDVTARRRAIDDRRRARDELARVSRLTTMGMLTASIAHEVNQPLSGVVTNGEAARRWLRAKPPNLLETEAALERLVRDGNRAAAIIRSIRQLLTPSGVERRPLSLHDVIRRLLPLVDHELAAQGVVLTLDLAAASPQVVGDAVQLQQLMLNLVLNALDSLRGEERKSIAVASRQNDEEVIVSVTDSGKGFGDIAIDSLFEPFTTTKPEGMGVGLAICHHIVESHGGRIWAEAGATGGAVFQFTLPLAEEDGKDEEQEDR